jgi:hypothetical protein
VPVLCNSSGNNSVSFGVTTLVKLCLPLSLGVALLAGLWVALPSPSPGPILPVIVTAQYDNARTGANLLETALTPQNVNAKQFGRLSFLPVDGDVYAQPLFLPSVEIPGKGTRSVIFVATEHDSVYAFDAAASSTTPLWQVSFLKQDKSVTTVLASDVNCPFIQPEIGITSTPVIDPHTRTLYVLARTKEANNDRWVYRQKLHALDVATGAEKFGGPILIQAQAKGGSFLGFKSQVDFDPLKENQRAALLLTHGNVYITWASSCDVGPYYGWVMAYDAHTLAQTAVLNVSPVAGESGIWQSDAGPAADADGNVYLITGNGKFTAADGGSDFGDSVLKLSLTPKGLEVRDYFTPADEAQLNATDGDFGSGSPMLLPDQPGPHPHLLLAAGKAAKIYALDRDHLGKFHKGSDTNAVQVIKAGAQSFGAPAYWNGHVFYFLSQDVLRDYALLDGRLSAKPVAKGPTQFTDPGATPTISANGTLNAIVWVLSSKTWDGPDQNAILFAYDAANVASELYNSEQNPTRDRAGMALRFAIPTVANGRVYIGTKRRVYIYGLLPAASRKAK